VQRGENSSSTLSQSSQSERSAGRVCAALCVITWLYIQGIGCPFSYRTASLFAQLSVSST